MAATATGVATAAIWLYLLLFRGGVWRLRPEAAPGAPTPRSVVAVIPARDEAACVGRAIASLLSQRYPGEFRIVLVDDHSSDGTAAVATAAAGDAGAADRFTVAAAKPLPPGWAGPLWGGRPG